MRSALRAAGVAAIAALALVLGPGAQATPAGTLLFLRGPAVWTMNADGSGPQSLNSRQSCTPSARYSPDGARIAYYDCNAQQLLVIDSAGGHPVTISSDQPTAIVWAGGSTVVWSTSAGVVKSAPADGTGSAFTVCSCINPTANAAGTKVAVSMGSEIWTLGVGGGSATQLTSDGSNSMPAWSPDGSQIAYIHAGFLYDMAADGSSQHPVDSSCTTCLLPVWAPDSSFIVYYSGTGSGFRLFLSDPAGASHVLLFDTNGGTLSAYENGLQASVAVSTDGTTVFFGRTTTANGGASDVVSVQADGANPTQLTHDGNQLDLPADYTSAAAPPPPTPQDDKSDVLTQAQALKAASTRKPDRDKLQAIVTALTDALAPAKWVDENHLVPRTGDRVFDDEVTAAKKLEDLEADPNSQVPHHTAAALADELVEADRILAETAYDEAFAAGGDAGKLAAAQTELTKAAQSEDAGNADGAIGHYKNAWHRSEESIHAL